MTRTEKQSPGAAGASLSTPAEADQTTTREQTSGVAPRAKQPPGKIFGRRAGGRVTCFDQPLRPTASTDRFNRPLRPTASGDEREGVRPPNSSARSKRQRVPLIVDRIVRSVLGPAREPRNLHRDRNECLLQFRTRTGSLCRPNESETIAQVGDSIRVHRPMEHAPAGARKFERELAYGSTP